MSNQFQNMLREGLRNISNKPLEAIEIINKFDYLQKAFKYIIINNKANNAPYHNLNHLLTVTKFAYQGMLYENLDDKESLKLMLLTTIFHDVNHSAGKKSDDVNVSNSKKALKAFVESEDIKIDLDEANKLLDATQYPYVIEAKDLTELQKIIRDADLTQVFEYNWIQQNIIGLSTELNIDFFDFLKGQRKFLDNAEFNSKWGKALKKEKWNTTMKQFDMLENIAKVKIKII